ncbi:putative amidase enhancer [Prochlorococcus marinus str. LG]|nr:putative amidase enhancer [Prochlorococcus marinus str. LG]
MDYESKANNVISSDSSFSTHWEVSKPLALKETKSLLVSLEPYLGREAFASSKAPLLKLVSADRPLLLKDSNGLVHKASEINIGWRNVQLKTPRFFIRKVIGPFASFESAQRISLLLEEDGVENFIAHPSEWEIWVSKDAKLPNGLQFNEVNQKVLQEVKPVLETGSGNYLLSGDVSIQAPDGLLWKGGLYSGEFLLKPDAYGTWTFIEKLPIEKYLRGVLPHEIGSASPSNALAAQAVLARTWAIANSHRFSIDGYHLCSDTQCQIYKDPAKANDAVIHAIKQTHGRVLNWNGKPINAVYHATNGGVSAAGYEAWAIADLPYLRTMLDGSIRWKRQFLLPIDEDTQVKRLLSKRDGAFGNNHRRFRWKRILKKEDFRKALNLSNSKKEFPQTIRVLERGPSGRVVALEIKGDTDDSQIILRLDAIRRTLRNLPSTLFIIEELEEGVWEFIGGGFGHGAGLSQAGAIDLALRGWNTTKILKYYYPGTTYESFK